MERVKSIDKIASGDFMYHNGVLAIIEWIDRKSDTLCIKFDNGERQEYNLKDLSNATFFKLIN